MGIAMNKRASYALFAGDTLVFNTHAFAGGVVAIQDLTPMFPAPGDDHVVVVTGGRFAVAHEFDQLAMSCLPAPPERSRLRYQNSRILIT
jgi:hypothetical protein